MYLVEFGEAASLFPQCGYSSTVTSPRTLSTEPWAEPPAPPAEQYVGRGVILCTHRIRSVHLRGKKTKQITREVPRGEPKPRVKNKLKKEALHIFSHTRRLLCDWPRSGAVPEAPVSGCQTLPRRGCERSAACAAPSARPTAAWTACRNLREGLLLKLKNKKKRLEKCQSSKFLDLTKWEDRTCPCLVLVRQEVHCSRPPVLKTGGKPRPLRER